MTCSPSHHSLHPFFSLTVDLGPWMMIRMPWELRPVVLRTESCNNWRLSCEPCLVHQLNSVTMASWVPTDGVPEQRGAARGWTMLPQRGFICSVGSLHSRKGSRNALS